MTHPQEGGTGGEVSDILFFSAKSKRRPSLIYSMQIIPVCLSIVARRKGVSATRRGGLNWTPISLLVGHPCKLFHTRTPFTLPSVTDGRTEQVVFPLQSTATNIGTCSSDRPRLLALPPLRRSFRSRLRSPLAAFQNIGVVCIDNALEFRGVLVLCAHKPMSPMKRSAKR